MTPATKLDGTTTYQLHVPRLIWRRFKSHAALRGTTVGHLLVELITEYLNRRSSAEPPEARP